MEQALEYLFRYVLPVALTVSGGQAIKRKKIKVPAWLSAVVLSGFFSVSGLAADGLFAKPAGVIVGQIAQTWGAVYIFSTLFYSAVWKAVRSKIAGPKK